MSPTVIVNAEPDSPQSQARETPAPGATERANSVENWLGKHLNAVALAVVAAGFVWRMLVAGRSYFNPDELLHYLMINQPSAWLAYKASLTNAHPPLIYAFPLPPPFSEPVRIGAAHAFRAFWKSALLGPLQMDWHCFGEGSWLDCPGRGHILPGYHFPLRRGARVRSVAILHDYGHVFSRAGISGASLSQECGDFRYSFIWRFSPTTRRYSSLWQLAFMRWRVSRITSPS